MPSNIQIIDREKLYLGKSVGCVRGQDEQNVEYYCLVIPVSGVGGDGLSPHYSSVGKAAGSAYKVSSSG